MHLKKIWKNELQYQNKSSTYVLWEDYFMNLPLPQNYKLRHPPCEIVCLQTFKNIRILCIKKEYISQENLYLSNNAKQ